MIKSHFKILSFIFVGLVLLAQSIPNLMPVMQAAPLQQPTAFKTPTPGPDGKIFYTVRQGDTIWSIAAISGLSVEELRTINNLHPNQSIKPGDTIFLGLSGPALLTPTPAPITPILPTPTVTRKPDDGSAKLCIMLYNDINGNSMREAEEPSLPGNPVTATEKNGKVVVSKETGAGIISICLGENEKLPPGEYTVSVAIPPGYNPTTKTNYQITLNIGDETYLNFGAQTQSSTASSPAVVSPDTTTPSPSDDGKIPIFGILGGFFLLIGIGVGVYAARLKRL